MSCSYYNLPLTLAPSIHYTVHLFSGRRDRPFTRL